MPDELIVLFTAMVPVGELRASIPLGLITLSMPLSKVFTISVLGNLIPAPFLLILLRLAGSNVEQMQNPLGQVLRWRTNKIRTKYPSAIGRYAIGIIFLLVAIPLPLTGMWTACLASWTLNVPFRHALIGISLGIVTAGIIVSILIELGIRTFT